MISSMNKVHAIVATLILFVAFAPVSAQNTKYYKLVSVHKDGTSNKQVSGGLFITFAGDLCFESTKNGVGINHGTLKRNDGYSNSKMTVYDNSTFWGKETEFIFNADKSVLNVVFADDEKYVFRSATPPANVTTCSLIRKKEKPTPNPDPPYPPQPIPPYPPQPVPPTPNPPTPNPTPQPTPSPSQETRYPCSICNQTGEVIDENGAFTLGIGDKKYCNKCKKEVFSSHVHVPCKACHGKGYTK
jgi:hypothetical protein